jgi:hypothetical protein
MCNKCFSGYYLQKGVCIACSSNCTICSQKNVCQRCQSGYFLLPIPDAYHGKCLVCDSTCLTCSIKATRCLTCRSDRVLSVDHNCVRVNPIKLKMVLGIEYAMFYNLAPSVQKGLIALLGPNYVN